MRDPTIRPLEASKADGNAADARAAGPILTIRGVHQEFSARSGEVVAALDNINLEIAAGEFVAFVGISGCGKTTLMKIVGGLISPTQGDIIYKGERVTGPIDDLGIVFQKPVLLEWRTVLRNITLQTSMRGLGSAAEQRRLAEDLLGRVGLAGYGDRFPWELSGGQQQRVSLCRALVHSPGLLLMDEPFGALDALTREQLQRDLERMWLAQKPTVLFVTHDVGRRYAWPIALSCSRESRARSLPTFLLASDERGAPTCLTIPNCRLTPRRCVRFCCRTSPRQTPF
jgi:NitT/TauT family transport system ATP-binding protein